MRNTMIVSIRYGMLSNNPNRRAIQRKCNVMSQRGYQLRFRHEHPVGCLMMMFTSGLARGRTELTFVLGDGS